MKLRNLFGVMAFAALSMVMFNSCKDDDKDSGIEIPEAYVGAYTVRVTATTEATPLANEVVELTLNEKGEVAASFILAGVLSVNIKLVLSDLKEVNGVYYFKIKKQTAVTLLDIGDVQLEGTHQDEIDGYDGHFKIVGNDKLIYFVAHGEIAVPATADMIITVDSSQV
jgi:hypothetical protein